MELEDLVDRIETREQLAEFVSALRRDLVRNEPSWENPDLPRFLEAMSAWIAAANNYYTNTGQDIDAVPPWRLFGDILLAARIYE